MGGQKLDGREDLHSRMWTDSKGWMDRDVRSGTAEVHNNADNYGYPEYRILTGFRDRINSGDSGEIKRV